uniref:MHC class I antigen n=1 Tax=Ctenopharyngodon idella TaxID=7959 RepID=A0A1X9PSM7_CTEID|nr:MHC class I antigen [Ctenopharyngodon idella]
MRSVVLLLLGVHLAYAGMHSLKYFFTGVSGDIGFPEYTAVGLVDEGQFYYFDSNIKQAVPKTEWIRQNEGADYWDRETQNMVGYHQNFKNSIQILKERFNQSAGVHTWQVMYGCELNDDGTTQGFYQYGYDGADFVSLDKNTLTWTAANPQAVITKHKWEATAFAATEKVYLENTCVEWLKKYVAYGKDTLERKVSPQVSLLQKTPSSPVTCHATSFYPSGVKISWQKNGQDHDEDVDLGELLSNEDGTFQRMSTLNVGPDEWKNNRFSCVVEHQDKTIRKAEDDTITNFGDSVPIAIIVGAVAAVVLVIVIGVVGYLVYQRKKGFKPVSASDDGSNSSART